MSPQDFALAALLGVSLLPTVCGLSFKGGGPEHRIAEPGATPTCEGCKAAQRDKVKPCS